MVVSASDSILFIPDRDSIACNAVVLPPATVTAQSASSGNDVAPILVWEFSVTDLRAPERVDKCLGWFEDGELISKLKAARPGCPIAVLLCWPDKLVASAHTNNYAALVDKAVAAGVELCVVDEERLRALGVVV